MNVLVEVELQVLSLFHGDGEVVGLGEIAVVNSDASDSFLAIRNRTNDALIYFITSGAVYTAISTLSAAVESNNTELESKVNAISGDVETLSGSVITLNDNVKGAVMDVLASGATGAVENNYIQVTADTTASGDFAKKKTVGIKIDVAESLGSIASDSKQLANAYAAQEYVKTVSGNIETSINNHVEELEGDIEDALESAVTYTDSAITVLEETIIDDIKKDLTDVYTFKGSVENYNNLPDAATYTGKTGDVYNVQNASGVPGSSDYVAAGTNFAFVSGETSGTNYWDPLGGTIDLSNYYTSGQVETRIEEAKSQAISSANSYTDSEITALDIGQYAVSSITHTEIVTAREDAKAWSSAYTDQEINRLSATVNTTYYTSAQTEDRLSELEGNADVKLNDVSGDSKNVYITLVNESIEDISGADEAANLVDKFTIEAQVAEAISTVSATGKLADAKDVKDYVDSAKNAGVTSAYTAASGLVFTEYERAKGIEDGLQSRIEDLESASTTVSAVTAVTFTDLAAGTGVEGGTNANRNESGVAAKVENNTLKLDFDNLVIDCGSFDS